MGFKKIYKDFKEFAVKGNMFDLAVGIIIGTAFTKVVNSLVGAIFMPLLGVLVGEVDFKDLKYVIKEKELDDTGTVLAEPVVLKYGEFIQSIVDFFIIAVVIFAFIKIINAWKKKAEDPKNTEVPTPKDIELLSEIRDLLKEQNSKSV